MRAQLHTLAEMPPDLGVSYRQIDYWIRQGAITIAGNTEGSGTRRHFSDDDFRRLRFLGVVQKWVMAGPPRAHATPLGLVRCLWDLFDRPHPIQVDQRVWYLVHTASDNWVAYPNPPVHIGIYITVHLP